MEKIICNKCGRATESKIISKNLFHKFKFRFQYPSEYDMKEGHLNLCENCLLELNDSCKIKVDINDYDIYSSDSHELYDKSNMADIIWTIVMFIMTISTIIAIIAIKILLINDY